MGPGAPFGVVVDGGRFGIRAVGDETPMGLGGGPGSPSGIAGIGAGSQFGFAVEGVPGSLFRPYRAWSGGGENPGRIAVGYAMTPRWGW